MAKYISVNGRHRRNGKYSVFPSVFFLLGDEGLNLQHSLAMD
jgi:hypothetical protein